MSFCDDCEDPQPFYKEQILKGFARAKRSNSEVRVKLEPIKMELVIRPNSDTELLCHMVEALLYRRSIRPIY